jgi:thiol-disulfide isomerase/thioredoxin
LKEDPLSARTTNRLQGRERAAPPASRRRVPWVWIALGVIVVGAAVIAVIATRGSDTPAATPGLEQTRPVEVTGDPLATLGAAPDPALGSLIPELQGATFDGTPVDVTRGGKAKIILFVAHWCPHCQREVPLLVDYLDQNPMPSDVELITIATGTRADLPNYPPSSWLEAEGWSGPVMADSADSTAARAFGLSAYPYFVVVDSTGHLVTRATGELTTEQFADLVEQARG